MDINSMLSGEGTEQRPQRQPPPPPQSPLTGGQPQTFTSPTAGYASSSNPPTPFYAPPRPPQQPALTPSHGQYPFPHPPAQSPVGLPYAQPPRAEQLVSPGPRPPLSHAGNFGHPPLLHQHPILTPGHTTTSHSPTPSSHPSQTPLSTRHSPLSAISQHPPAQLHYHQSQPGTPVGPPQLQHQRSLPYSDLHSPIHQRTSLGVSTSMLPSALQPGISPRSSVAPSPHVRRTSDYLAHLERERSESVSPKTMVAPRPPSMSSRHSSQHDMPSARSSLHVAPAHVTPAQRMTPSGPGVAHHPTSDAAHSSPMQNAAVPASSRAVSGSEPSAVLQSSPQPVSHHSRKMDMHHLLTPTNEVPPPTANGAPLRGTSETKSTTSEGPNPNQQRLGATTTSPADYFHGAQGKGPAVVSSPLSQSNGTRYRQSPLARDAGAAALHTAIGSPHEQKPSLKRTADSDLSGGPSKQRRVGRHMTRPPWAVYSKHNPRFQQQMSQPNGDSQLPAATPLQSHNSRPSESKPPQLSHEPSSQSIGALDDRHPWLHNPPLDFDLINARKILGPWEKTFVWNTPYPDLLRAVQDWMYVTLEGLHDVGWSAQDGTVEIEAKIGTLLDREDQRCNLPVATSTLIHPAANKNYRFESQMTVDEHKSMNGYLNAAIRDSMQKGRVNMSYQHLYEVDSFRDLSPAGLRAIPSALQRRQGHREPRLRTTTEMDKTGQAKGIKARIVKLNIDNIHIFNPMHRYDCRISINLEVNLDQPGIDPSELIKEPTENRPTEPNRSKDRVSYKHLAYSIDLTKVTIDGLGEPKHELEVEVDGNLLREHHRLLKAQQPNAFADLISGFLDNATFLMRQRAVP